MILRKDQEEEKVNIILLRSVVLNYYMIKIHSLAPHADQMIYGGARSIAPALQYLPSEE